MENHEDELGGKAWPDVRTPFKVAQHFRLAAWNNDFNVADVEYNHLVMAAENTLINFNKQFCSNCTIIALHYDFWKDEKGEKNRSKEEKAAISL